MSLRLLDEDQLTVEGELLAVERGEWEWAAPWRLDGTRFQQSATDVRRHRRAVTPEYR